LTRDEAKRRIIDGVKEYYDAYMRPCDRGGRRLPYAGRVFDGSEVAALVESALEFWLTAGRWTDAFEDGLREYLGVSYCSFVNSGSSANLLALSALSAPELGERALVKGDEVITVAAAFPTTVAPIVQCGFCPVFLDITIPQYNIDTGMLERARTDKTKAVMIAHTLGNPFDLLTVKRFCDAYGLWLIEDNCDALGSSFTMENGEEKMTGTVGDIGTSSFYPPHHITTGEGGAVYTDNGLLHSVVRSLRDWGRDCVCRPGEDNRCGKRFDTSFGLLPCGYDHKYVYSRLGYNLKATDMQAAVGCAQLEKLPSFVKKRRENWTRLCEGLSEEARGKIILPEAQPRSNPSWFGFLMTCAEGIDRNRLVQRVEEDGIQTRTLFAGNLLRHPCFDSLRDMPGLYRTAGGLANTDRVMRDSFWVGVYPGLDEQQIDTMIDAIIRGIKHCEQ
jgi:CDP-6-deoxy-D-xylo-4-hexulose-3-dehydrase